MPHLESRETQYNLRPHPLPVPRVTHAYAESCLLYKLVEMKNKLATSHKLIFDKNSKSHSFAFVIQQICFKYNDR